MSFYIVLIFVVKIIKNHQLNFPNINDNIVNLNVPLHIVMLSYNISIKLTIRTWTLHKHVTHHL